MKWDGRPLIYLASPLKKKMMIPGIRNKISRSIKKTLSGDDEETVPLLICCQKHPQSILIPLTKVLKIAPIKTNSNKVKTPADTLAYIFRTSNIPSMNSNHGKTYAVIFTKRGGNIL